MNEKALADWGLSRQKQTNNIREELYRVSAGLSAIFSCLSWFRQSLYVNGPFRRATIAVFQTIRHHFLASFNSM
jgi:hypothetical protein